MKEIWYEFENVKSINENCHIEAGNSYIMN